LALFQNIVVDAISYWCNKRISGGDKSELHK